MRDVAAHCSRPSGPMFEETQSGARAGRRQRQQQRRSLLSVEAIENTRETRV